MKIVVPQLAESITEGTIAEWLKNVGDLVEQGESVAVLETDKVNIEVTAESSGVLLEILKEEGDTVEVGDVIATLDEAGEAAKDQATSAEQAANDKTEEKETKAPQETSTQPTPQPGKRNADQPIASPAARRQAREKGIDLGEVQTRDPLGRVRVDDVKAHSSVEAASKSQTDTVGKAQNMSGTTESRPVERVRMSRRRQTIAKRLVEVQHNSAMLTTFNEVDMTAVLDLRKRRKDPFYEKHNIKLGFMSFFTKAVIGALKEFPRLNAEIQGDEMLLKKYYDIGVAVSAEEGLVVPVIRDADRLTFAGIEKELADLADKARNNKLTLKDLQGGTFTITNGGVFGSLFSTPILNAPQVGILGMHAIQRRPVAVGNEMQIRPMMYIALSYDHRIVDGAEAVSFLVRVKEMVEDPETLLLEG